MSDELELGENWTPTFEKEYAIHGNRFRVQVENIGIINIGKGATLPRHAWFYAIVVNDTRIVQATFYWDPSNRKLTDENVANQLASYWGTSEKMKERQILWEVPNDLDKIVLKCADFMFRYYNIEGTPFDYDILRKAMDDESWTVALMPNVGNASGPKDPYERMILFYKHKDNEMIQISTFTNQRNFSRRYL
jgi:hypothetical protein